LSRSPAVGFRPWAAKDSSAVEAKENTVYVTFAFTINEKD